MYNVKGPSKIVAKTRRGVGQKIDKFREHSKGRRSPENDDITNVPKPVFQNTNKRVNHNNNQVAEHQPATPQHEEIVKYINESWNCIYSEIDSHSMDGSSSPDCENSVGTLYYEDVRTTALDNFQPFDLESWWGKRLYTLITNSVDVQN